MKVLKYFFNWEVVLLVAGSMAARGASYPWLAGQSATLPSPAHFPTADMTSLARNTATLSPNLYSHLILGTLIPSASLAGQPVNGSFRNGGRFNWGRVGTVYAFSGHFQFPPKPMPQAAVFHQPKPGPMQFSAVPTLDQNVAGPHTLINNPTNSMEPRLP
jgi:hypothetical protein